MWQMLIPLIGSVLDKVLPDTEKASEAKAKLMELQITGELQQMANQARINEKEAEHSSLFVAGWRPAIGWVCALALFYQYLVRPFVMWGCAIAGVEVPPMPGLDDMLWELMFGMLGIGGLRSIEKIKGVAR